MSVNPLLFIQPLPRLFPGEKALFIHGIDTVNKSGTTTQLPPGKLVGSFPTGGAHSLFVADTCARGNFGTDGNLDSYKNIKVCK